jgi:drug/metabolite transporter (DMT)-like permease
VKNRGIARGRMFVGALLVAAAAVVWATAFLMSPHGTATADGPEHVRTTVALFLRNAALGILLLSALGAYLLFPRRRPRWPWRDRLLIALIAVLVLTSLYQLIWVQTTLL